MIITKNYENWFRTASDDDIGSMFNHAIYTFCNMRFFDRVKIALEILLGKEFCIHISENQKRG